MTSSVTGSSMIPRSAGCAVARIRSTSGSRSAPGACALTTTEPARTMITSGLVGSTVPGAPPYRAPIRRSSSIRSSLSIR